ncbi:hypothetical protein ABMA80_15780 [Halobacteriovorax sp. FRX-3]|uniref:hypothetical protein n=1 Tax=Halobacteriovorax sp. FRX-3 TaxID=3157712 RepID=UPI0037239D61
MPNPFDQNDEHDNNVNPYEGKDPKEIMEEFVGEGKKYKTVEDAVKALAFSQHHISTLESETAKLREAQTQAKTIDEVLATLQKKQQPSDDNKGSDNPDPVSQKPTDDLDVEATVKRLLEQHTSTAQAEANHKQVVDAVQAKFGSKAFDVWDKAEKELGINLEQMAQTSPAATLKLLGISGESAPAQSAATFKGDAKPTPTDQGERPPEGSKRLVDYMLSKGEINRTQAYNLKLKYSADPEKYRA